MASKPTRQLAFRLPQDLISRIQRCEDEIAERGLRLSRTDVVRLLLTYALNVTAGDLTELLRANLKEAQARTATSQSAKPPSEPRTKSRSATKRAR